MQKRWLSVERLEALARRAVLEGGRHLESWSDGQLRRLIKWDLSMDCSEPHACELHARYSATHGKRIAPIIVVLSVRCRKCTWCRKMRERFWQGRAIAEFHAAPRTWMGTLTASLDEHVRIDCLCRVRLDRRGVNFDGLPEREKFEARIKVMGEAVTLWLKRLRVSGLTFRYLLVAEEHNSVRTSVEMRGRPHFHCLIHEIERGSFCDKSKFVRDKEFMPDEALPRASWTLGFSRFEVARDARTAGYLCKYLTKEMHVRIRASQFYGDPVEGSYRVSDASKVVRAEPCTCHNKWTPNREGIGLMLYHNDPRFSAPDTDDGFRNMLRNTPLHAPDPDAGFRNMLRNTPLHPPGGHDPGGEFRNMLRNTPLNPAPERGAPVPAPIAPGPGRAPGRSMVPNTSTGGNRGGGIGRAAASAAAAALGRAARRGMNMHPAYSLLMDLLLRIAAEKGYQWVFEPEKPWTVEYPSYWRLDCALPMQPNACNGWGLAVFSRQGCGPNHWAGPCPTQTCSTAGNSTYSQTVPYEGASPPVYSAHGAGTLSAYVWLGEKTLGCQRKRSQMAWVIPGEYRPTDPEFPAWVNHGPVTGIPAEPARPPIFTGEPVEIVFPTRSIPWSIPIGIVTQLPPPPSVSGGSENGDPDDYTTPINTPFPRPDASVDPEPETYSPPGGEGTQPEVWRRPDSLPYELPGGRTIFPPNGPPPTLTPPSRGTRERKIRIWTPTMSAVQNAFHAISEVADAVNCLFEALPAGAQGPDPAPGTGRTLQSKMAAVYWNLPSVDWPAAMQCLLANQIEDAAVGRFNAASRTGLRHAAGYGRGGRYLPGAGLGRASF